jgi:DMSO/TMAO reductase YedYZ molybdopterin-dependent catalytic subunit
MRPLTMPAANSIAPITRSTSPLVVEFAFAESAEQTTPNDRFFVRNHFPVPAVDPLSWNVRIEGALEAPCTVSLAALREMSAVTVSVVLECAGNGRAFMQGNASSIQWQLGGVGCATFTGVPLRDVLAHTRLPEDAVDVVFEGADHGPEHKIPGRADIHFARSVPLAIAMRPDVILAYEMNGQPLEPDHGAPLRVIVPGWYGVASVKWLSRIIIATRPFTGYFQSAEYTYWKEAGESGMERVPVTTLHVKSEIARPYPGEDLAIGVPYRVFGAAWTCDASIESVDVSTNGGVTWLAATLGATPDAHAWQLWAFEWTPPAAGSCTLMARATDSAGRVQPMAHDTNHENYMVHHVLPIEVRVG